MIICPLFTRILASGHMAQLAFLSFLGYTLPGLTMTGRALSEETSLEPFW